MSDATPEVLTRAATVTLREITKETLRPVLHLNVAENQKNFVATNAQSIAEAYFSRENAWFRAVFADETPVGFLMLYDEPAEPVYFLWRFMIDARYQGFGFGKRAIALLVAHVKTRPHATELGVSCVPGDGSPCPFYEKLGFVYTGEKHDNELILKLKL
ncbi:MAG: GNAT family N-acetyltransferase [Chloroflexi bacterium]|nr:GNAT family N-acetyltransferase [Chloroflexota bacterium]